jgi:hypothetical protein
LFFDADQAGRPAEGIMRSWSMLLLTAALLPIGCSALKGYIPAPRHHFFGTVEEQEFSRPVEETANNLNIILQTLGYSVRKPEIGEEEAVIHASKDSVNYVIDVTSIGTGCLVHIEADQAGNGKHTWTIFNELKSFQN